MYYCYNIILLDAILPTSFGFSTLGTSTTNGSSATAGCSRVRVNSDSTTTCLDPASSVLFDGVIPTLTGLNGNMWASQLLTLERPKFGSNERTFELSFSQSFSMSRVEVTIFNCPQWGTAVEQIRITLSDPPHFSIRVYPTVVSCDSLLKVCIEVHSVVTSILFSDFNNHVQIAEVGFYQSRSPCPLFTTIPGNVSPPEMQSEYI